MVNRVNQIKNSDITNPATNIFNENKQSRRGGFATIYIVITLASIMMALLVIIEVAEGFGCKSLATTITTSAGESVLGEYNVALYKRYGIFAVRRFEDELSKEAAHYINGSSVVTKGLLRLKLDTVDVYTDRYPALDVKGLSKQIMKLAPEALLKDLGSIGDSGGVGLGSDGTDGIGESGTSGMGSNSTGFGGVKIPGVSHELRSINTASLPSKLLGYSSRESVLLSGGIAEVNPSKLIEDEYILAVCSNKQETSSKSYLAYETEYILFGNQSDTLNLASLRRSIYAIRYAKRLADAQPLPADPLIAGAILAAIAAQAEVDVNVIVEGDEVDGLNYQGYLRLFLSLLSKDEKLARLMDIMQININYVDGVFFAFSNYAYGFDMIAKFNKRVIVPFTWGSPQREGIIEQTHVYK
ncbi:MAG: DUF5702 domain-containing protein [Clostridia bacterium]|nr:DUF5702 domain-containing protein [Clostridia bacterium]